LVDLGEEPEDSMDFRTALNCLTLGGSLGIDKVALGWWILHASDEASQMAKAQLLQYRTCEALIRVLSSSSAGIAVDEHLRFFHCLICISRDDPNIDTVQYQSLISFTESVKP
jgi:hypothetical protein